MVEAADHLEVLVAGQVLVDRRVLAGQADAAHAARAASRDDVEPGDARRPGVGLSSVVRMRTAVVLPAPFGPSSPSTLPAGAREVDAAEGAHLAVSLLDAARLDGELWGHRPDASAP